MVYSLGRLYFWILVIINDQTQVFVNSQSCRFNVDTSKHIGTIDCSNTAIKGLPDKIELNNKDDDDYGGNMINYEKVDLRNCKSLSKLDGYLFFEKRFSVLKEFYASYIPNAEFQRQNNYFSHDSFQHLKGLTTFEFTNSQLENALHWALPSVQFCNLDDNSYTEFDAENCPKLEKLSMNNNQLKFMVKFSDPAPPLKELYLKNNPLNGFLVGDIVRLCELRTLVLEMAPMTSLNSADKWCDCEQLKKWVEVFSITGTVYNCSSPTVKEDFDKCDLTFNDVAHLRNNCPDADRIPLGERSQKPLYIFYIVLALLLLLIPLLVYMMFFRKKKTDDNSEEIEEGEIAEEMDEIESYNEED